MLEFPYPATGDEMRVIILLFFVLGVSCASTDAEENTAFKPYYSPPPTGDGWQSMETGSGFSPMEDQSRPPCVTFVREDVYAGSVSRYPGVNCSFQAGGD